LLNVVQRPDGSIDPEVEQMLNQLADWNAIHGEAIFGSRPWTVYGESTVKVKGGSFNEEYKYSSHDIRFTTKGPILYAIALGWPEDGQLVIKSLAKPSGQNINNISSISLLGYKGKLVWKQTSDALYVTLPTTRISEFTAGLKIRGTQLQNVPFVAITPAIVPDAKGDLTLSPNAADIHGSQLQVEDKDGQPNLGFWDKAEEYVTWKVKFPAPGKYKVVTDIATINDDSQYVVKAGDAQVNGAAANTGDWAIFKENEPGQIDVPVGGEQTITFQPKNATSWKAINLRWVKLKKVD